MLRRFVTTFAIALLLVACDDGDSLREGLAGLPRDTASDIGEEEVYVDSSALDSLFLEGMPDLGEFPDTATPPPTEPRPGRDWTAGTVQVAAANDSVATLTGVRTARQDEYDRIVFEFARHLPGYTVEYVDQPIRRCGSGQPVATEGQGWLRVRLSPARAHDDAGRATVEDRNRRPRFETLRQLVLTCDFEAEVEWVLAVSAPNRFRVLTLPAPSRLVIDVRR